MIILKIDFLYIQQRRYVVESKKAKNSFFFSVYKHAYLVIE